MRVCMYLNASVSVNPYRVVIVLPYYMHSYVFSFLSRMLYHYVCVFQSCYSDRKKGVGAERGKEQGRSICVQVYLCISYFFFLCIFCMYIFYLIRLFVCLFFFLHTYIYIHIHAYRHIYIHTYVYTYMDVCTHMYVRMYTLVSFIKIYKRECLCIHIYVHIYL